MTSVLTLVSLADPTQLPEKTGLNRTLYENGLHLYFGYTVPFSCFLQFLFFLFFFTPSRSYAPALPKAKGKAWFGVMQSFTALQRGWTIYRETLRHALDLEATRCFHLFSFTELLSFSPSFYSISVGSAHSIRLLGTRCPTK